ncbi:DNA-directed RNA polymerase subunit beta' [Sediminitomix flava]|uniref:DNA-directed RNA polymerase subunit beta' n=1 Tax=Sediminitomix flava TaxID=379075 RepID=A0A315ZHV8_SEDFL|nr:DNA-directed RNA polymerase subunit beta' [Sediminitomix flava]PWJ44803.1 DNA-directed RNA polymerase subunit beta' [Sediminitomix flava]
MAFRKNKKINTDFTKVTISLASPESILESSHGEVTQPETINYRTYKPEMGGLFCERIFGPVKDWECHCGKYKRIRYKGIVCDRCGVEVTEKKVRRERMGHISLVVPVAHIWYFRSLPNKIGYLLGLPTKKLDQIIYYERYVVIQPGIKAEDGVQKMDFLTEDEYLDILDKLPRENQALDNDHPDKFIAKMGADALEMLLSRIQLDELSYQLRDAASNDTSQQRKAEALKRLKVVEAFRESNTRDNIENRPEWMIIRMVPVIPPELRPLVPLDGGRFATSDLNDLYRRVIIRNNRLKRLIDIKAPEVILRNEKRMLQEAVDSLFDNSRKVNAVRADGNRPLKSLSDMLKGKQGRFRQNLLGKRVDYSGRSVIVVGPQLKLHECGLPKNMAAELFKPFIIRKLIERGIVKTVKSAKKIVDRKDPVVWDILENVLKGHPVLLNRAPTLHRLGIQAFQPKLIEGKAIQLHPLVCTAFNADFDGDQMAVHVPLGHEAILEASLLMLASHNILNPANGNPVTVPSQDMVLGLYYITKGRYTTPEEKVPGEGMTFYSAEEVIIGINEGAISKHAYIKLRTKVRNDETGELETKIVDTVAGRVIVNQFVPEEVGYVDELLSKKSLQKVISKVFKVVGMARTAHFLDDIKHLGFQSAYKGGLSFGLDEIQIPAEKVTLVEAAKAEVETVTTNFMMGLITDNERYNQVIDIWTRTNNQLTNTLMERMETDQQGFNSIYMMMHSGARGSREQIRQLGGMRGLMAKPQKNLAGGSGGNIIENPILSNFKEGLDVLEYFISTHGARKGLADTALKTADAGYLTRRLVDVAQDVVINDTDCGTLRGLEVEALKDNDEIVESLGERIVGRTSLHDISNPVTGELIVGAGEFISEAIANKIEEAGIEKMEIRSVLTCETKQGVCSKCYGQNLATGRKVQKGESVGVIAAQSIGEPGTQLTLRTFHVGGVASHISAENTTIAKQGGKVEFTEMRAVSSKNADGNPAKVVMARTAELNILDDSGKVLYNTHIPYGSYLRVEEGDVVEKGTAICEWDPFNAVILAQFDGTVEFENIEDGITYKEEFDEQTGYREKIIIESRDRTKNPTIIIRKDDGETSSANIPVGAHLIVEEGQRLSAGDILVKIPRSVGKSRDITGGLPRVTELFEARNPSSPAVVAEIDGVVSYGGIKRGNRELFVESKDGIKKRYLVSLSKHILVQENDFVKAGMPLSDGAITPADILAIKGPTAVQAYLVNEIQDVYRLQGVKINDKHIEVIVRQMMQKVFIQDSGDTTFLGNQVVDKFSFREENDKILNMKVVTDAGESDRMKAGMIISPRELRDENSSLKRRDKKIVKVRDAEPARARPILQGITQASLDTKSFISAASFQETTKVLSEASIRGKVDKLVGLKENVIVGHLIPAGAGARAFQDIRVGSREEYEQLMGGASPAETKRRSVYSR